VSKGLDRKFWKGLPVLVTGGTGFVGQAVVARLLELEAEVAVIARNVSFDAPFFRAPASALRRVALYQVDVRSNDDIFEVVNAVQPQIVIHLAAMTQVTEVAAHPLRAYETNVLGTANLLHALRGLREAPSVVVASSDKALGEPEERPSFSWTRPNPIHPYDTSKAAAELVARSYAEFYGLRVAQTRFANIYGPGDTNWKRLIPGTIRSLLRGERPVLRSDGKQVRQYVYVGDCAEVYLNLAQRMHNPQWGKRMFTTGYPFTFDGESADALTIVGMIAERMNRVDLQPVVLNQAQDETQEISLDGEEAAELFGIWRRTDLGSGLAETIDWLLGYLGSGQ